LREILRANDQVYAAGKSYAAAVDNLRRCRDPRAALARTSRD